MSEETKPIVGDELLAEINRTYQNAKFGYDTVDSKRYSKHIGPLLEERKQLLESIDLLKGAVKTTAKGQSETIQTELAELKSKLEYKTFEVEALNKKVEELRQESEKY